MTVKFAPPISVERYVDRADDRLVLRQIIDEVMYEIRNLTGQEYVNEYANKRPEPVPVDAAQPAGDETEPAPVDPAAGNGGADRPEPVAATGPRPRGRILLGAEAGEAVPPRSSAEVLANPRRRVREPSSS